MIIDKPQNTLPLRQLWKEAFGDGDAFLDSFFTTAFSPERCLCARWGEKLLGALYWLDVEVCGRKWAYFYGVATAEHSRGKGVCHALMAAAHEKLEHEGYAGTVLVPGTPALSGLYKAMGYDFFGGIREVGCKAAKLPVEVKEVDKDTYAALRRKRLPPGGVVQEGENLDFLQTQARLYAGEGFVMAARYTQGALFALEFLGDERLCPGVLKGLSCEKGVFRMPGEKSFAMYRALQENIKAPTYFGFAFD